jgi:hypothetical protein
MGSEEVETRRRKASRPGVTETPMPKGGVGGNDGEGVQRGGDRVEVSRATAPKNHSACPKVLHRKSPQVKLKRTKIVTSERTNIN